MLYAVCTSCAFLRAWGRDAEPSPVIPKTCPACGGKLMVRRLDGRFPPVYVSRVALDLLATPELPARDVETV